MSLEALAACALPTPRADEPPGAASRAKPSRHGHFPCGDD